MSTGAGPADVVVVNAWCGPRNVSTALMYAFRQRADTTVVDEPLYAHYLRRSTSPHPGRDEVLAAMDDDGARVVREVILAPAPAARPVRFCKQMAHHLVDLDLDFLGRCRNFLLVRDPVEVLATIVTQLPDPTMADIGIERQTRLVAELAAVGQTPPVLDARRLLDDPPAVLEALCARLGLTWDPAMLAWPAGPKPEDGVWAPHWYANAHASTGFARPRPAATIDDVPAALHPLAEEATVHYRALLDLAL